MAFQKTWDVLGEKKKRLLRGLTKVSLKVMSAESIIIDRKTLSGERMGEG